VDLGRPRRGRSPHNHCGGAHGLAATATTIAAAGALGRVDGAANDSVVICDAPVAIHAVGHICVGTEGPWTPLPFFDLVSNAKGD
jgi:hypothetical protein